MSSDSEIEEDDDFEWDPSLGLQGNTAARYSEVYNGFADYCASRNVELVYRPNLDDKLVTDYLKLLKSKATTLDKTGKIIRIGAPAEAVISSILTRAPGLDLPYARRYLKLWRKQHRPFRTEARPLSREQIFALVGFYVMNGFPERALLCITMFVGWLRIGEALKLTMADIKCISKTQVDGSEMTQVVFTLRGTKTRPGYLDTVVAGTTDEAAVKLMLWLLDDIRRARKKTRASNADTQRIFTLTYAKARRCLQVGFDALESNDLPLDSSRYSSHSFRRSAATIAYTRGWTIIDIMHKGRWRSEQSLLCYIRDGRMLLSTLEHRDPRGIRWLARKALHLIQLKDDVLTD